MPSPPDVRPHRRSAALAVALLLGGLLALLCMRADREHASLFGIEGPRCLLRSLAGETACPGCGLTRSAVLTVHGDLGGAWAVHPGGLLAVVAAVLALLVQADVLRQGMRTPGHSRGLRRVECALVLGIVAAWLARLV